MPERMSEEQIKQLADTLGKALGGALQEVSDHVLRDMVAYHIFRTAAAKSPEQYASAIGLAFDIADAYVMERQLHRERRRYPPPPRED